MGMGMAKVETWETNFSLGIPQESTPSRWMRGEYG